MNFIVAIIGARIVPLASVVSAAVLACKGISGWWWFLIAAGVLYSSVSVKCSDSKDKADHE
jgi:hypothetical protein